MHYEDHQEALIDFELLNSGTRCTPYEYCYGVLAYMEKFEDHWNGIIEKLHDVLRLEGARLLARNQFNRFEEHKFKRNDFALFYRFLTEDVSSNNYQVSKSEVTFFEVKQKKVIEWMLRAELEKYQNQSDEIVKKLNNFETIVQQQTALFEDIWGREGVLGAGISASLYRWLLDVYTWLRNKKMYNVNTWEEFVGQIFRSTNGGSRIVNPKKPKGAINATLSGAGKLPQVCKYMGFEWERFEGAKRRKPKSDYLPKAGYDISHIDPVSEKGEGPTILEPAPRNRGRGAKPIKEN